MSIGGAGPQAALAEVVGRQRRRRSKGSIALWIVTILGMLYLFVPLVTIAVFTFTCRGACVISSGQSGAQVDSYKDSPDGDRAVFRTFPRVVRSVAQPFSAAPCGGRRPCG